ncbi:hypothetical protein SARC_11773 [Sphaeroforma arctica JP610]|uniref:NADP-dependent oxidoreductase domain-containing protein n=1 Tax=Sphaeroforma arctica JP610 TaxID=667725 RepID=A0A0L0FG27_9EUKA|nr:hypothetical protein SARC_11773 [Sphaeroforma arctica JP610]KNC75705.1 hypothetical protein SARC_11773 [Sphaeroforma arctica JP610]|eukprot:XP_014149607.1 hypothetical protein SARC_11773 [Sphaeroforma arctica JP610]
MDSTFTLVSGNKIPVVGLGTWQAEKGVVGQAVKDAIELGYRHIDCAAIYGNEKEIGEAFKEVFAGDVKREDVFVTSKLWNTMHAPEKVEDALKKTLSDLGLEYLDLYLIHWPVHQNDDGSFLPYEAIPIGDTWKALEACVDKGLVRDIGVSNFSAKKVKQVLQGARIKPAMNQIERHAYLQQPKLLEYCLSEGIRVTAYSPLGSPGNSMYDFSEKAVIETEAIQKLAEKHNVTAAQVCIRWAIQSGTVTIPKSTKRHRIQENATVDFKLSDEDMKEIAALDKGHRYCDGSFWTKNEHYTLESLWEGTE